MANEIEIVLRAHDQASQVLAKVQQNVQGAATGITAGLAQAASGAGAFFDRLKAGGESVGRFTHALAPLVPSLGLVTGGLAGVTAVLGAYVAAVGRAAESQAHFNVAMRSLDLGGIRGQLHELNTEIERMAVLRELAAKQGMAGLAAMVVGVPTTISQWLGFTPKPEEERAKRIAGAIPLLNFETGRQVDQLRAQALGAQVGVRRQELMEAMALGREGQARELAADMERLDAKQQQLERERIQREGLMLGTQLVAQGLPSDSAAELTTGRLKTFDAMQALEEQQRQRRWRVFQERGRIEQLQTRELGQPAAGEFLGMPMPEELDVLGRGIREELEQAGAVPVINPWQRRSVRDLRQFDLEQQALRASAFAPSGEHLFPSEDEQAAIRADTGRVLLGLEEKTTQQKRDGLSIDQERLGVLAQMPLLSQQERDAAERMLSFKREALKLDELDVQIAQARKTGTAEEIALLERRKDLASFTEGMGRARAEQERQIRLDPFMGLEKFFAEQSDKAQEFGTVMYNVGQVGARSLQSGLGNAVSDWILQEGKKGADFGKQFASSMVRGITAELAGLATSSIFASLRGAFSQFTGSPTSRAVAGAVGLGGAGVAAFPEGASAAASSAGGAILIGGRYLSQTDVAIAQAQAGPAGIQALASGQAIISGGQLIGEPSAGLLEATGRGGLMARTPTGGFTAGQYLGLGATAAAYGLSLYGAYQGTTTNAGVALNTGLGVLMGAAAGYQYGGSVYAAGIGAIVAGLGSLITSLAGKAQNDARAREQRQAVEAQRAVGAAGDLVSEANRAQSLQEFFDALTAFGSGTSGGTRNPAVMTSVQTPTGLQYIGSTGRIGANPVAGVEDLFAYLPTLQASIQAGVAPAELAAANEQASLALRERGQQLLDDYNARIGGVDVFAERDLGGGVTERTTVPGTRASALEGSALFASQIGIAGLTDDDKELFLRDLIRVAGDRGLRAFVVDPETDQIVSITNLAAGMVVPPPPGGTIIPPPGPLPDFSLAPFAGVNPGPWRSSYDVTEVFDPERERREAHLAARTAFTTGQSAATRQQLEAYFAGLTPQQLAQALSGNAPELAEAVARLTAADRQALGVRLIERVGADAIADLLAGGDGGIPGVGPSGLSESGQAVGLAAIGVGLGLPADLGQTITGLVTGTPIGLAGQGIAAALAAAGVPAQTANVIGSIANTALGLGTGIGGAVNIALGLAAMAVQAQVAAQNLALLSMLARAPRSGGADPATGTAVGLEGVDPNIGEGLGMGIGTAAPSGSSDAGNPGGEGVGGGAGTAGAGPGDPGGPF